ncbi:MAG TPA: hypothetical protein VD993_06145 [Chitinophagaceae bacterium]|nr:hypothetical protein [Chitinophagaceae bacterium]
MHDREFEKQVQQKMQELRFQPGGDVWARVQADIRRKKRRRPMLLWILFAGLLIGSAWILYSNTRDNEQPTAATTPAAAKEQTSTSNRQPIETAKTPASSEPTPGTIDNTVAKRDESRNTSSITDNTTTNSGDHTKNPVRDRNTIADKTAVQKNTRTTPQSIQKNDQNDQNETIALRVNSPKDTRQKQANEKPAGHGKNDRQPVERVDAIVKNDLPQVVPQQKENAVAVDSVKAPQTNTGNELTAVTNKPDNTTAELKDAVAVDQPSAKQPPQEPAPQPPVAKKTNPSKYEWGFSAGSGVSDLGKQLFHSTFVADLAYNAPPTTSSPIRRFPSAVMTGAAFNAGGFVSKSIGKKFKLKLGLNYEYYSNRIRTGSFVDSSKSVNQGAVQNVVHEYYDAGTSNQYTNGYHFVSLPLSLQWRVNNNPKFGVVWENSISIARLLHSNALHFDGITGTYYKDNRVFHKTQGMFASSILFNLKTKNNLQLYLGPHLQYGFTNLVNNNTNNDKHVRYAGLKMMIGFTK